MLLVSRLSRPLRTLTLSLIIGRARISVALTSHDLEHAANESLVFDCNFLLSPLFHSVILLTYLVHQLGRSIGGKRSTTFKRVLKNSVRTLALIHSLSQLLLILTESMVRASSQILLIDIIIQTSFSNSLFVVVLHMAL